MASSTGLGVTALTLQKCSVSYPKDKLLQILSDASAEFRFVVIGEDLDMLPEGL